MIRKRRQCICCSDLKWLRGILQQQKAITVMIEVICNDRLGKKIKVKCLPSDTIGDFKKVLGLQIGADANKLMLKRGYMVFKDHISLEDYEVHDGTNLDLYYS